MTAALHPAGPDPGSRPAFWAWLFSARIELRAALLAGAMLGAGFILDRAGLPHATALYWISLGLGFFFGGRAAWQAIAQRKVDIDVLMIVGAGLAASVGHPEEGALLLFLFVLSGSLEDLAMQRTTREVEALHQLMPTSALMLRGGSWTEADPSELAVGERVKIRAGERVPADARVVLGRTEIDQSALTGESMPRSVGVGDIVYSGTINTDEVIEAEVTKRASESSLQRVLELVTTAREQREPVQRFIDRFSEPYAVGVLAASVAVFAVWWLVLGRAWNDAASTAITLLIVASPCALIIATPTATLAAIGRAARCGVLFKGGQALERLARIRSVCFDKTGTLTYGKPRLQQVHAVAWSDGKRMLSVAAALEADSTHPIAQAVRASAAARGVAPAPVTDIRHTAGRGLEGVHDGAAVRLGSYRHAEPAVPICLRARVQEVLSKIQERGQIGVVVARSADDTAAEGPSAGEAAVLILSDAVRPGARTLVSELHALGVRPVRMLTGDNRATAQRVAEQLGLDAFDAELMPQDKLAAVGAMKAGAGGRGGVAVIGDGVNDAPALAAADVAVAIGSIGSDAALESADVVLLSDDLSTVPWAVRLARRTRATIAVNFAVALGVIVLMVIATIAGSLTGREVPLAVGVLAHEGGTLLVVLNSLGLLLVRSPRQPDAARPGAIDSWTPAAAPPEAG